MEPTDADIESMLREASGESIARLITAAAALGLADPSTLANWVSPTPLADGSIQIGYPRYAPVVDDILGALYDVGAVIPFDWSHWPGLSRLSTPDDLAGASLADVARFVTAVLRSERFADGAMVPFLENGALSAAASRLATWLSDHHNPAPPAK